MGFSAGGALDRTRVSKGPIEIPRAQQIKQYSTHRRLAVPPRSPPSEGNYPSSISPRRFPRDQLEGSVLPLWPQRGPRLSWIVQDEFRRASGNCQDRFGTAPSGHGASGGWRQEANTFNGALFQYVLANCFSAPTDFQNLRAAAGSLSESPKRGPLWPQGGPHEWPRTPHESPIGLRHRK